MSRSRGAELQAEETLMAMNIYSIGIALVMDSGSEQDPRVPLRAPFRTRIPVRDAASSPGQMAPQTCMRERRQPWIDGNPGSARLILRPGL